MKLYLDIDGILNDSSAWRYGQKGYQYFAKLGNDRGEGKFLHHISMLDRRYCDLLVGIVEKYKIAEIIICSTWRKVFTPEDMQYMFYIKGYPQIADIITRSIMSSEAAKDKDASEYVIDENLELLKQADIDILNDILTFGYSLDHYRILSDDVSYLRNNIYPEFHFDQENLNK